VSGPVALRPHLPYLRHDCAGVSLKEFVAAACDGRYCKSRKPASPVIAEACFYILKAIDVGTGDDFAATPGVSLELVRTHAHARAHAHVRSRTRTREYSRVLPRRSALARRGRFRGRAFPARPRRPTPVRRSVR
jgi:hypothetical protein